MSASDTVSTTGYPIVTEPDSPSEPQQGVYMPVRDRVYVAVGYQPCSTTMVVGVEGVIIIDPGEDDQCCAAALADLRRFSDLPVRAVICTHQHGGERLALAGLGVTEDDVRAGRVDVIAHQTFATASFAPTTTVGDSRELIRAGVRMTVFLGYSDGQHEIDVWFPDLRHLHGSGTVQGESFPDLTALRGTSHRDFRSWYRGVDTLLGYAWSADSYSGSHMRPWTGNDFITERITNYRDAIEFLHDQSARAANRGRTGPELAAAIAGKLPAHLREDPWLQPRHGNPKPSVGETYAGHPPARGQAEPAAGALAREPGPAQA